MKKEKAALKFFNKPADFGSWLVNTIGEGFAALDDGRCDVQAENPDDAKHARSISSDKYAEVMRDNLVAYLKTKEGLKEFTTVMRTVHDDLTSDVGREDEEDDDG